VASHSSSRNVVVRDASERRALRRDRHCRILEGVNGFEDGDNGAVMLVAQSQQAAMPSAGNTSDVVACVNQDDFMNMSPAAFSPAQG
jgi:hypothetical protein